MEAWMEDELVKDIPKEKLEFLAQMMTSSQGKTSQKQLLGTMLPLMKQAREKGLQFTPAETGAAIAAIKKHSSPQDNQKIDELLNKVENAKNQGAAG